MMARWRDKCEAEGTYRPRSAAADAMGTVDPQIGLVGGHGIEPGRPCVQIEFSDLPPRFAPRRFAELFLLA